MFYFYSFKLPPAQPTVNHASVVVVHRSRTAAAAAAVHFLPGLTRFVRAAAAAESTAASYESGTTRLDPYYDRRQSWPIQPLLSLLKQENFISCGK